MTQKKETMRRKCRFFKKRYKYSYGGVGRTNFGLPIKKGKYIYEMSVGHGIDKKNVKSCS